MFQVRSAPYVYQLPLTPYVSPNKIGLVQRPQVVDNALSSEEERAVESAVV